ncbi:hypothetical protein Tco_0339483 [Tanacetum coccineum]
MQENSPTVWVAVDGVRYVVHSRDERRTTQNSGICSPGPDGEMYYGQLQEIIEFKYLLFKVALFRILDAEDPSVYVDDDVFGKFIPSEEKSVLEYVHARCRHVPTVVDGGGDEPSPQHTFTHSVAWASLLTKTLLDPQAAPWIPSTLHPPPLDEIKRRHQHALQKVLQSNQQGFSFKPSIGRLDPTTGDLRSGGRIRRHVPKEITAAEWISTLSFENDPRILARAAQ